MALHSAVDAVLERAGATMVDRSGHAVPLHFGSSAGELAACSVAVGEVEPVEHVTVLLTGTLIAPGSAAVRDGAVWCASAPDRLLVVGDGRLRTELATRIARVVWRHPAVTCARLGEEVAGFELLGPHADDTLAALGIPCTYGPAVQHATVAGAPITVVRRSWARALVLAGAAEAVAVWAAIDRAGAPFGITCVGADAVARFRFVEPRISARRTAQPIA
jgi:glycine cleavage system aminomethyltransferase T